ncbi:MAG: hypothetical protein REI11_14225, partial [Patulibacter sp.]|nr:hypothetical protein [Patulibacter sp.]
MTKRRGTASKPRPAGGGLGDLLDIAAVEPRGLVLTSSGRYVRVLALDRVPNLFSANDQERADAMGARQALCASIPDGQELAFMVCRDPLPAEQVGAQDARAVRDAARRDLDEGHPESARARLRLAAMTDATIELASSGDQGASFARHYALAIWTPNADGLRERVDDLLGRRQEHARVIEFGRHYEAASASAEFVNQVAASLSDQGVGVRRVEGPEVLELLWERLHPAAGAHPRPDRLRDVCAPVLEQSGRAAARRRARLVDALCEGFEELDIPAAAIDDRDPRFVRHADGTLEEVVYLSRQPQSTDPWWLDPLSLTSLSSTLVVRIRPHERSLTRLKVSANARRKSDAIETEHRKGRRVTREDIRVAEEVEVVEDEMQRRV